MNYIRWFEEIGAADVGLVGGKGANLGEMIRAGLPVPPGFCLVAGVYRDFIQARGLDEPTRSILAETRQDDPADVEAKTAHIRGLIIQQEVPATMVEQILDSYHRLAQELGVVNPAEVPVAVHSSATAEDLPTASFVGQQDTYLNICGAEALIECIKHCWASLWTARAVTYRARQDFDHHRIYLAVVVQAMIPSEVSGILFTANAITGDRDEAVINASWGLGEAIVSGLVTPDTITVRKSDGHIVSRQIAVKERIIEYAREGGTVERAMPTEQQEAPALSDDQVAELVVLGQQIESHYGVPQDIEWGYAQGRLYILQSRPITTLASPVVRGDAQKTEYNRTMFIEIFPDPLSPLFLSVIQPLLHSMLDFTFQALGFRAPEGMEGVGVFYNQPYFNRSYIAAALEPLSPSGTRWSIWLHGAGGRGNTAGMSALLIISWITLASTLALWLLLRLLTRRSFIATRITFAVWPLIFGLVMHSWQAVPLGAVFSLFFMSTQRRETDDHLLIRRQWPSLIAFLTAPRHRKR